MDSKTIPTLKALNANDNPRDFGGSMLSDDGHNQLWLFGDKVANRYIAFGTEEIIWSDDVSGWNYDPETDCIPA